jgi:hypothetical protein
MTGKSIIILMAAFVIGASVVVYQAFKASPQFKTLAVDQMKVEFVDYSQTFSKITQLTAVDSKNQTYSVNIDGTWSFLIHNKTLQVTTSALPENLVGQDRELVVSKIKEQAQGLLFSWLKDKYHSQKDLLVEVTVP